MSNARRGVFSHCFTVLTFVEMRGAGQSESVVVS